MQLLLTAACYYAGRQNVAISLLVTYQQQFILTKRRWAFGKVMYFGLLNGCSSKLNIFQMPRRTQSRWTLAAIFTNNQKYETI